MTARFWHLFRSELRSHRWVLLPWIAAQLLVTASVMSISYLWYHVDKKDLLTSPPSFFLQLNNWCFAIGVGLDPWVDLTAGLLAAWIALADPLQSPTAFWPTRPARLGEIVLARALVCFTVFCAVPACCGVLAAWMQQSSPRDALLSGLTFLIFKAGLVPVGFFIGVMIPAPGRRLSALLVVLGLWLGSLIWSLLKHDRSDFRDHSLTYLMAWVLALAALPLLLRWRRSIGAQAALGGLALALPWITGPTWRYLTQVPERSTESLGIAALSATPKPRSYHFSQERENGMPKETLVELNLNVQGLPADVTAKATFANLEVEPQPDGKAIHHPWSSYALLMPTYYAATAHALGTTPDKFPPQWRGRDNPLEFIVPQKTFSEWTDDQTLKISGKVRLRLSHIQKQWEGVVQDASMELSDSPRVHGVRLSFSLSGGEGSLWTMRPFIADAIGLSDSNPEGALFNDTLASWMIAFQPPVKGPDGAFSRELRRTPALWADCARKYDNTDHFLWTTNFRCGLTLEDRRAPEIQEITKSDGEGLKGLPVAVLSRVAYAEVEVPLTPVVLTKRQILETRKITPAKP